MVSWQSSTTQSLNPKLGHHLKSAAHCVSGCNGHYFCIGVLFTIAVTDSMLKYVFILVLLHAL